MRISTGDTTIQVPRDRNSTFQSPLLDAYQTRTNEPNGGSLVGNPLGRSGDDV
jgi:hypothetical protein